MGFIKVVKNKAYYKRFQVHFRRRREAKTDYYARKRLIWVDKCKYDAPKFRFVVRFTNRDVIAAIVKTDVTGDRTVACAYGHELAKYGVKYGYNNYPAAYATGLLLARKVNEKFSLPFKGMKDAAGKYYNVSDEGEDDSGAKIEDRRPFQAVLDVGLHRTTTGANIFAALKGVCDGGVNIPHSTRRFPGTPKEKGAETDFEVTRKYIFGGHIADYMRQLQQDDDEHYKQQFAVAIKNKITPDNIEKLWQSVHDQIRKETAATLAKPRNSLALGYFKTRSAPRDAKKFPQTPGKYYDTGKKVVVSRRSKMSIGQRKARILAKLKYRDARLAQAEAAQAAANTSDAKAGAAAKEASESESGSGSESDE